MLSKTAVPKQTDGAKRSSTATRNRLTRFVFTLNNWTEEELAAIKTITNVKWLIVGKERGENNTDHLQGACVIGRQLAFSTVKKMPGMFRAHIEIMRGSPQQSKVYCSKEDQEPYEYGTLPEPGKRNDLHDTLAMVMEGKTMKEICADADNMASIACLVRYNKGINYVKSLMQPDRKDKPVIFWLCGPTEVGKTRSSRKFAKLATGTDAWLSPGSLRWFDGYDGDRCAILDDLRTKHIEFSMLLRLLDRYPLRVEYKGGFINWIPQFIFITAPYTPRSMWSLRRDEDIKQLERRITYIIECDEDSTYESILTEMLTRYNNDHLGRTIERKKTEKPTETSRSECDIVIDLTVSHSASGGSDGRDANELELIPTLSYSSSDLSLGSYNTRSISESKQLAKCGQKSSSSSGPGGYLSQYCTTTESYHSEDDTDSDKCKDTSDVGNSGSEAVDSSEESANLEGLASPLSQSMKLMDAEESYARYNTDYETKRREVNNPRYEEIEVIECDEAIDSDEWKSYLEDRVCGHTPDNHSKTKFF